MEDADVSQCLRDIGLDPNGRRRAITKRLREALAFFAAVDSGANRRGDGEPEGDWLVRVLDVDSVADLQRHVGAGALATRRRADAGQAGAPASRGMLPGSPATFAAGLGPLCTCRLDLRNRQARQSQFCLFFI